MTWVKLSDTFAIHPRWDALSVDAFAIHVAALCDCAQKLTDGHLTAKAVRRLPIVDDPESAAQELVAAGIWEQTPTGYLIVDYLADQELAADIYDRVETKKLYDKEFQRDRRRAVPLGLRVDEYRAKQAAVAGQTVGQWLSSQRGDVVRPSYDVVSPVPSRPDPSRPVRGGKGRGSGIGLAEGSPDPDQEEEEKGCAECDESYWPDTPWGEHGLCQACWQKYVCCSECAEEHQTGAPCRCPKCGTVLASAGHPRGREGFIVAGRKYCANCVPGETS